MDRLSRVELPFSGLLECLRSDKRIFCVLLRELCCSSGKYESYTVGTMEQEESDVAVVGTKGQMAGVSWFGV